jgi:hypothetical protein
MRNYIIFRNAENFRRYFSQKEKIKIKINLIKKKLVKENEASYGIFREYIPLGRELVNLLLNYGYTNKQVL